MDGGEAGSDLPGGLGGFDPPTSGFDSPFFLKKRSTPHFSLEKEVGGSGFGPSKLRLQVK